MLTILVSLEGLRGFKPVYKGFLTVIPAVLHRFEHKSPIFLPKNGPYSGINLTKSVKPVVYARVGICPGGYVHGGMYTGVCTRVGMYTGGYVHGWYMPGWVCTRVVYARVRKVVYMPG